MAAKVVEKFGIELLLALYGKDALTPEQNGVIYTHWAMLMAGFRCIGLGDAKELMGNEKPGELLPEGWDSGPNHHLRYFNDKKHLYLLKVNSMGNDAIVSLIRAEDMKITSMAVPLKTDYEKKDWNKLAEDFYKEVVAPLEPPKTKETSTQRSILLEDPEPRGFPILPHPFGGGLGVGRTDIDPLGRYGPGGPSGMIFDPHTRRRYPGIRHDPILPGGNRGRAPGPDPDHFQPPGFGDDYFL